MTRKRNPERAAVRIARKLVSEIRRRRLRPGTQLDAEHRMVEELGVARATVREALRFLELQGALRIKAAETERSMSELVNEAVKQTLAEDAEDLAAFEERATEPNLPFEDVVAAEEETTQHRANGLFGDTLGRVERLLEHGQLLVQHLDAILRVVSDPDVVAGRAFTLLHGHHPGEQFEQGGFTRAIFTQYADNASLV